MKPTSYLILTIISLFAVAINSSGVSAAPVSYKKKVQVQSFQNTPGWAGTYNPGALVSDLLKQKLLEQGNVVLVRFLNQKNLELKAKNEPVAGNVAGEKSPAQIIISGRIIKYRPAMPLQLESTKTEKKMAQSAEAQIEFKFYQGQTKRFIAGFVAHEKSADGELSLGYSQSSLNPRSPDFRKTYMGKALIRMADKVTPLIVDYLNKVPLDGQVIAVEKKEDQMIINVGRKSGVEIRDDFIVYSVDAHFPDPLYKEDVGDRLTKLGVVRVINVQEGFSEAVIMAGGDFIKGNLVRSKKFKPLPRILNNTGKSPSSSFSPQ